jgi:HK97 family phage major capsid protein
LDDENKILRGLIGQRQERTFTINGPGDERGAIDDGARTVELAFASETRIERWYGTEVLRCDPASVLLARLNAGGALLSDHDSRAQIGAVVPNSARADGDRVCRATVKFSQRQAGADEFQDVKDGIRTQVSVGYLVHEYTVDKYTVDKDTETYTATKWEPLEISLVSIAADVIGSGVGRELEQPGPATPAPAPTPPPQSGQNFKREAATMDDQKPTPETPATVNEVGRATEIMELAKVIDAPGQTLAQDVARDAIAANKTLAEFRQMVFDKRREHEAATQTPVVSAHAIELSEREKKQFSIRRAILADVRSREDGGREENCFELEVSNEIARRLPNTLQRHGGILIPTTIALRGGPEILDRRAGRVQQRAGLDTKTATKGQELVFTEYGSFIELLRNRAMVIALGATVLPGLQGNVAFPRQTGAATLTWVAENPGADVAESNLLLDQVVLSPKTAQATTSYSRQLLNQAVLDVDGLVMDDLAQINALGIDLAALHGTGAPQPTGIYAASNVNSVAFGGSVTYQKLVDMETAISDDNADIGTMAYLATPAARGKGKVTPELSGQLSQAIWRGNEVNGYRAEVTNQLKKNLGAGTNEHGLIFGVWAQLMIGEWGVLEIITDPYAKKKQGMIEVTSFIMVDIQLRHGESFCKATGLIP